MRINIGDYVTLKSIEELKYKYICKDLDIYKNDYGKIEGAYLEDDYYSYDMLSAMGSSNVYRVERALDYKFALMLGTSKQVAWFHNWCIQDVYKLQRYTYKE